MQPQLISTSQNPRVYDRLRAFSLFWREGIQTAISAYPEQERFIVAHMDKSFEEVLRACFRADSRSEEHPS